MAQIISTQQFNNLVKDTEGIAIVDFFAVWCGPCKMIAPLFEELEQEFKDKAKFYKIDIDESLDVAREFNISSVPTIMIFKNGEPVERLVGFLPKASLIDKITLHI